MTVRLELACETGVSFIEVIDDIVPHSLFAFTYANGVIVPIRHQHPVTL
jgi:hypothetical protein